MIDCRIEGVNKALRLNLAVTWRLATGLAWLSAGGGEARRMVLTVAETTTHERLNGRIGTMQLVTSLRVYATSRRTELVPPSARSKTTVLSGIFDADTSDGYRLDVRRGRWRRQVRARARGMADRDTEPVLETLRRQMVA